VRSSLTSPTYHAARFVAPAVPAMPAAGIAITPTKVWGSVTQLKGNDPRPLDPQGGWTG